MDKTNCPLCEFTIPLRGAGTLASVACPVCGSSVALGSDSVTLGYHHDEDVATPDYDLPSATEARTDLIGKTLGGCRIESLLGEGAMGTVYKAWQESLEVYAAIKTIHSRHENVPDYITRFEREAKVTARFSSPYVIKIKDTGYEEGIYYLIMEYVDGENLATYFPKQPGGALPPDQAITFLEQVATGLLEAEHLKVVHRDIKPANLLVTLKEGMPEVVRIADFGVLRDMGNSAAVSATGSFGGLVGTPMYMSPEQMRCEPFDHRSDMFSLGATFYQMITGKLPAPGKTLDALRAAKVNQRCLSPRRDVPERNIPKRLSAIIERMTAVNPDRRYPSFRDLLDDLKKAKRPLRSRRAVAAMILVPAVLAAGAVIAVWQTNQEPTRVIDRRSTREGALEEIAQTRGELAAEAEYRAVRGQAATLAAETHGLQAADLPEVDRISDRLARLVQSIDTDLHCFAGLDAARSKVEAIDSGYEELLDGLKRPVSLTVRQSELARCHEVSSRARGLLERYRDLEQQVAAGRGVYRTLDVALRAQAAMSDQLVEGERLDGLHQRFVGLQNELERHHAAHVAEHDAIVAAMENAGPESSLADRAMRLQDKGDFLGAELRGMVVVLVADLERALEIRSALGPLATRAKAISFEDLPGYLTRVDDAVRVEEKHTPRLRIWASAQRSELREAARARLFGLAEVEWTSCAKMIADTPAAIVDRGLLSRLEQLETHIGELAGVWGREVANHASLREASEELPRRIAALGLKTPRIQLPADWPEWAKRAWPMDHSVPAGLVPSSSAEGRFTWQSAPARTFSLVLEGKSEGRTVAPFLIERELVSTRACEEYFQRLGGSPNNKAWRSPGDDSPVVMLTLREAYGFASRAQKEAGMTFPSQAELSLATREGVVVSPQGMREIVRPHEAATDRPPLTILVGRDEHDEYWQGNQSVGFRCCYPLRKVLDRR